ncbi:hypothetical protein BGZ96_006636 [Linnemannia gamsii]|uniref:Uncharacterized protein n=1 Tax=Linnemannia gamsii TaxID=64522 RepID=A0ABQ7K3D0_9FUNG|nr:hypothetical protein BGZ96_006636 [Linnemannia gamsii]
MPSITRIRQATESTPNLSLHGGAHVLAVNAQAELIVHPHIAKDSTTSRQEGLSFITNSTPDLPSIARSWSLVPPSPSAHSTETYKKENATFFEPFQQYSHGRGGQASRYVSFHFDLSHLEKTDQDTEDDLALATKAYMGIPEQGTVDESDDGENEYEDLRAHSHINVGIGIERTRRYKLVNGITPGYAVELLATLNVNYDTAPSLESDSFGHRAATVR